MIILLIDFIIYNQNFKKRTYRFKSDISTKHLCFVHYRECVDEKIESHARKYSFDSNIRKLYQDALFSFNSLKRTEKSRILNGGERLQTSYVSINPPLPSIFSIPAPNNIQPANFNNNNYNNSVIVTIIMITIIPL